MLQGKAPRLKRAGTASGHETSQKSSSAVSRYTIHKSHTAIGNESDQTTERGDRELTLLERKRDLML